MSVVVAVAVAVAVVDLDDDDECCCCCWNFDTLTMLVLLLYLATKQPPSSNSTALGRANLEPLDLTSPLNRTVDIVVAAAVAEVFLFDSRNCYCLEDESYCSVVDLLLLFDSCFDS